MQEEEQEHEDREEDLRKEKQKESRKRKIITPLRKSNKNATISSRCLAT